MVVTGKGHRRVAAKGNYVLVFFLALCEFGLEIVELLPTMLFRSSSLQEAQYEILCQTSIFCFIS